LEIINRLERAQLSQSRMASSVSVGGGRGSLDVVGASQRGRIRKTWFIQAFVRMHSSTVIAWLAGGGILLQLR
jgi:hypothetical protein